MWWSLAGDAAFEDLESWSLAEEEGFGCDVGGDTVLVSLADPRPLRPRSLSGTSRGVVGSGSVSGEAPRSRPLVLVEVTTLSLGFRPRREGGGWAGSAELGLDMKSSSLSSDEA